MKPICALFSAICCPFHLENHDVRAVGRKDAMLEDVSRSLYKLVLSPCYLATAAVLQSREHNPLHLARNMTSTACNFNVKLFMTLSPVKYRDRALTTYHEHHKDLTSEEFLLLLHKDPLDVRVEVGLGPKKSQG